MISTEMCKPSFISEFRRKSQTNFRKIFSKNKAIRSIISGNCPSTENYITWKLGEIYMFYAVTVYQVIFLRIALYRSIRREKVILFC